MTADRWQRIQGVFEQATALPPAERATFLAQACHGDKELRGEVESLLEHDAEAAKTGFLRSFDHPPKPGPQEDAGESDRMLPPTEPPAPPSPHPVSRVPHSPQIEGYELLRELNRGGQGVVYQALQKTTKRKVAIKVLLEGPYASKSAQKRFEREIELVAQLKHPSIITVFHSGTTPDWRPFYVMDYVRGLPLHQYVREKKLALEETLKLFATVCEGVQYAHQKGVIHRDLKPGNILVDADGVPKIMDFGLAKVVTGAVGTLV